MGLWIGRPGALREIVDGAESFDRSPDLAVSEFRALNGGVTTWAPPSRPRRLKLSWTAMERADVAHLDRLARRVHGPGPVAVVDPLAGNMLDTATAEGMGTAKGKWSVTPGQITLWDGETGPYVPMRVSVDKLGTSGTTDLDWLHPTWASYPVAPGMTLTWWVPGLVGAAGLKELWLFWHNAAGVVAGAAVQLDPRRPLVATVPAGMIGVRPTVRFGAVGVWALGQSVLALGDTASGLLAGERPPGEGTPPYSVTGYKHSAVPGAGEYRDVSLDLVEVTG